MKLKNPLNRIAKCQIKHPKCRREYCQDRFICHTNRFSPTQVRVSNWLFRVKNDEAGREFIKTFRASINRDLFFMRVVGRAKDRKAKGGDRSYVPLGNADYFVVYVKCNLLADAIVEENRKEWYKNAMGSGT